MAATGGRGKRRQASGQPAARGMGPSDWATHRVLDEVVDPLRRVVVRPEDLALERRALEVVPLVLPLALLRHCERILDGQRARLVVRGLLVVREVAALHRLRFGEAHPRQRRAAALRQRRAGRPRGGPPAPAARRSDSQGRPSEARGHLRGARWLTTRRGATEPGAPGLERDAKPAVLCEREPGSAEWSLCCALRVSQRSLTDLLALHVVQYE